MIAPYSPNLASVSLNCSIYYNFLCELRRIPLQRKRVNNCKRGGRTRQRNLQQREARKTRDGGGSGLSTSCRFSAKRTPPVLLGGGNTYRLPQEGSRSL